MKILFVGSNGVGKSTILCRYTNNTYEKNTVGISFYSKMLYSKTNNQKIIHIHEINGARFWNIFLDDYIDSDVIFVVYDITRIKTFEYAKELVQMIPADKKIVLMGNKTDLLNKREVSTFMVNKFISECFNNGVILFHVETSICNMNPFVRVMNKFCAPVETINIEHDNFIMKDIGGINARKNAMKRRNKKNYMELFFELW
jgi:GTPase SAR1 family protein